MFRKLSKKIWFARENSNIFFFDVAKCDFFIVIFKHCWKVHLLACECQCLNYHSSLLICLSRMCLRRVRQIFFSYIGSHHPVVSILQSTFLDTLVWLPLYFRVFLTFSIYLTFHTPILENPIDYLLMRLLLCWIS